MRWTGALHHHLPLVPAQKAQMERPNPKMMMTIEKPRAKRACDKTRARVAIPLIPY